MASDPARPPPRPELPRLEDSVQVGAELARGGSMQVLEARHRASGEALVVKRILEDAAGPVAARLGREVGALAGLEHPNLARLLGLYRTADGDLALVYQRCPGSPLVELLGEGGWPVEQALGLLEGLASGLDALHSRALAVRDLKPENVVVDPSGHARIVDFGLVRGVGDPTLTASSEVGGTLEYLAPEVLRGEPGGAPADVYALGVLAYELLAGRLPFSGTPASLASQHLNDRPPPLPATLGPSARALDAALARALAKRPEDRPGSAPDFVAGLRQAAGTAARPLEPASTRRLETGIEGPGAPDRRRPARRYGPLGMSLGLATLLAAGLLSRFTPPAPAPAPAAPPQAAAVLVETTTALRARLAPGASEWPRVRPGLPGGVALEVAAPALVDPAFQHLWRRHLDALSGLLREPPTRLAGDLAPVLAASGPGTVPSVLLVVHEVEAKLQHAVVDILSGSTRIAGLEVAEFEPRWRASHELLQGAAGELLAAIPEAPALPELLLLRLGIEATLQLPGVGPRAALAVCLLEPGPGAPRPLVAETLLLALRTALRRESLPCGPRDHLVEELTARLRGAPAELQARLLVEALRSLRLCDPSPLAVQLARLDVLLRRLPSRPGRALEASLFEAEELLASPSPTFYPLPRELASWASRFGRSSGGPSGDPGSPAGG